MPGARRKTIQGVLFDWDGTLLNSYSADSSAYLAMFKEMGVGWGLVELAEHYSPNWYDVYRAAGLPEHHWDAADTAWRKHYALHRPRMMRGARKILDTVGRRYKLGLVTSGDRDRVHRQLREFRLRGSFQATKSRTLGRCISRWNVSDWPRSIAFMWGIPRKTCRWRKARRCA